MWWFVAILTLVTFDLVEGQGAGAVYSQECEQVIDGTPSYYACLGLPEYILFSDNANYKITSTPNNLTCGVLGPSIAYTLGFFTKAPCDNANSHPVSHMVDYVETIEQGRQPNYQTYWQSVTWWDIWDDTLVPLTRNEPPKMDIEINFDQRYQLQNDLVIFFNSSRPRKMTLFKSVDYGLNWTVWQYYDLECNDLTNSGEAVSVVTAEDPTAILCSSEYGDVRPYSGGVVRLDVEKDRYALFAGPNIQNYEQLYKAFETTDLIDFLTFTDIRISLEYPASTGDEYTGREIDLVRSWTAITDIQLVTACSCNLHARYCIQQETDGVNHTVCECQHNTMGKNCELCKPLYRNRPWLAGSYEPYPEGRANECQKCQCYDHAESCEYSIDDAMGICENCTHNTEGKNCQLCIPGYYHNASVPLNDPNTCAMCGCEPFGVTNASDAVCNSIGQCDCKVQVQGLKCDECIDMYYGLTAIEPFGECKGCQCNLQGTISKSNICEKENGQCPCKENICGRDCGECCDGYYSFPNVVSRGCLDCNCDPGGAYDTPCDPINGQCNCKPGLRGQYCNIADQGTYIPFYDAYQYQPASGGCDPKSALLTEEEPFTGHEFYECSTSLRTIFDRVDGANLIQPTVTWLYNPSFRYTYKSSAPWSKATLIITYAGNSNLQNLPKYQDATATVLTPACPVPDIGALLKEKIIYDLEPGIGQAWISDEAYSFDARCVYQATITMDAPGANSSSTILVDSLVLLPNLQESAVYKKADNATKRAYLECQTTIASLRTRAAAYTNPNCRTMSFAAMTELTGQALDCNCNGVGALPETPCEAFGGQCPCKAGVFGRRCDSCQPGFYAFSSTGCTECACGPLGSASLVCDYTTGQCDCKSNVATANKPNVLGLVDDLQCRSCMTNTFGYSTGEGCQFCNCKTEGSNSSQCDDFGACPCKETFNGDKCDTCELGYFAYASTGCTPCDCDESGSNGIGCDILTGKCDCKTNVDGTKCDTCKIGFFNLSPLNPDGCQPCFCYGHGTSCTSASGFTSDVIYAQGTTQWPQTGDNEYILAPDEFLGDQVTTYGNDINIEIRARGFGFILGEEKVVVLQGGGLEAFVQLPGTPLGFEYLNLKIPMRESEWRYIVISTLGAVAAPLPAADFFKILGNLTAIQIRRNYEGRLVDILSLSTTKAKLAEPGDVEVGFVENCTCVATDFVGGLSCDECAQGYKRVGDADDPYAKCMECECSDNSETTPALCDQLTGVCLNCRNGTVGDHCEDCAANVTEPDCKVCRDTFWGLSRDGCIPCDCDLTGTHPSSNGVCDKETGQCTCVNPTVAGRTCNECADNYQELTVNGCTECNTCYGLVGVEIDIIRDMRDNLTALLQNIKAADENNILGPFHVRLDTTLAQTETLLTFLNDFNKIEGSATEEINQLNSTLLTLKFQLDSTAQLNLERANISVEAADAATTQGFIVNNNTIFTAREANSVLWGGDIPGYIRTIESLVDSLKAIEFSLSDVSDSSLQDVLRVTQLVGSIEGDSESARALASTHLQTARDLDSTHTINRQAAQTIQNEVVRVSAIETQITENTNAALAIALEAKADSETAYSNASSIGSITTDVLSLSFRANDLRDRAQTLNTRALQSTVNSQVTINRVKTAQADTNALLQKVSQAETLSNALLARMTNAEAEAYNASKLANDTIDMATNMLETMQQFEQKVAAVSAAAAANRAQVSAIESESEGVITNATNIGNALSTAETLAQNSVDAADEAKTIATNNRDAMSSINTQSASLVALSGTVLNDIDAVYGEISNTNTTTVAAAQNILNNVAGSVAALETKTASAVYKSTNATTDTKTTKARVTAILAQFNDISQVDNAHILELQLLVRQARDDFDARDLENIVTKYRDAVNSNAAKIANMQQRVRTLQEQNTRLSKVANQLRVGKK